MGEPEAEGRRRVAPRHAAALPPLPGFQAVAGNRQPPATAHAIRGRRREGGGRGVGDFVHTIDARRSECKASKQLWIFFSVVVRLPK